MPKDGAEKQDPVNLDPRKKASLAKLFMHNPQFAETFFRARIGVFSLSLYSVFYWIRL
jgi:hypothetical protein